MTTASKLSPEERLAAFEQADADRRDAAHRERMARLKAEQDAAKAADEQATRRRALHGAVRGVLDGYRGWTRPDMTKRAARLARRPGGIQRPAGATDATNWELAQAVVAYDPLMGADRFAVAMRLLGMRGRQVRLHNLWQRARDEAGTS